MESGIARKRMNTEEYEKILPKLLEKIAVESKDKYLPENTPIFMQWIVKDSALLEPNRCPLPNTKGHPYQQRLYDWAKREPERLICLFYVGSGLSNEQKQKMEDLEKLSPNIRVINFNTLDLKEYDFSFKHLPLGDTTISNYYKNLYSIPGDKRINFAAEIDLMRVLILLKAGEALIESGKAKLEEIPESKAAIYFDFDILPNKEGKKIGRVKIPEDILMVNFGGRRLENSIVAVNHPNNVVLCKAYEYVINNEKSSEDTLYRESIYYSVLYRLQDYIIDKHLRDENLSSEKYYDIESKKQVAEWLSGEKEGPFDFYSNAESKVVVGHDSSYARLCYDSEDIDIDHSTSLEQAVAQNVINSRINYK